MLFYKFSICDAEISKNNIENSIEQVNGTNHQWWILFEACFSRDDVSAVPNKHHLSSCSLTHDVSIS
jgi:hypothetical protein